MLQLKISKSPPEHACLLSFLTGSDFSPANVGLHDKSLEWAENRSGYDHGATRAISFESTTVFDSVDHPAVVPFNISCRREDLVDPTPLPWAHNIGDNNTDLGLARFWVHAPLADSINPSTAVACEAAIRELRRAIKVLEIDGSPTTIPWDLSFLDLLTGTVKRVQLSVGYAWNVFLMIPVRDRPLMVQFTAADLGGNLTYNHRELVQATQYYTGGTVVDPGGVVPGSDDYALELRNDGTTRFLDGGNLDRAMAIALWSSEDNWTWEWDNTGAGVFEIRKSTVLQYEIDASALSAMTVKEFVQDINNAASANWLLPYTGAVKATLLLDYPDANELNPDNNEGPYDIKPWGASPVTFQNEVGVWYPHLTRMHGLPMERASRDEPWLPTLEMPPVRTTLTSGPLTGAVVTWAVPDRAWMPFSSVWSSLLEVREVPTLLQSDLLLLDHGDIGIDSVRVLVDGQDMTGYITDYDARGGLLRLSRDVTSADSIEVLYAWDPGYKLQLDWLDLNPGQLHFPEGYKVYFGVYVTASRIEPLVGAALDLNPTVGWVAGNSITELQAAVDALADTGTGFNLQAKLVAVYQSASTVDASDVKVLDVRSPGGMGGVTPEQLRVCPEVQFYDDIGFLDGEPYAGQGVVVVRGPGSILGTDTSIPDMAAPADGGFVDTTGRQQLDDIRRRASGHVTAGMYPIIDLE